MLKADINVELWTASNPTKRLGWAEAFVKDILTKRGYAVYPGTHFLWWEDAFFEKKLIDWSAADIQKHAISSLPNTPIWRGRLYYLKRKNNQTKLSPQEQWSLWVLDWQRRTSRNVNTYSSQFKTIIHQMEHERNKHKHFFDNIYPTYLQLLAGRKHGVSDFLCIKDDNYIFCEVKANTDTLKIEQYNFLTKAKEMGFDNLIVYVIGVAKTKTTDTNTERGRQSRL